MSAQLGVPAKITQPHPRRIHLRTRLFGMLNDAKDVPCIWICGPPGAGKTTLAASYCDYTENTTLWYQVDEGAGDIAVLIAGSPVRVIARSSGIFPSADRRVADLKNCLMSRWMMTALGVIEKQSC